MPRSTSKALSVGRGGSCSKGELYPFTGGHVGAVLHSVSITNALELGGFVSPVICQLKSLRGPLTPCAHCQGCRVRVHPHPRRWPQHPCSAPPADRGAAGRLKCVPGQGRIWVARPFITPASGTASGVGRGTQRGTNWREEPSHASASSLGWTSKCCSFLHSWSKVAR